MKLFVKDDKKVLEPEVTIVGDESSNEVIELVQVLNDYQMDAFSYIAYLENARHILDVREIAFFESRGQQVIAYVNNQEYLVKDKLYEIENKYPSFMRISKWCVANMNFVNKVHAPLNMTMNVEFKNCDLTQIVTRKYLRDFKERILGK